MNIKYSLTRQLMLLIGDLLIIAVTPYIAMDIVVGFSDAKVDRDVYDSMMPLMLVAGCILFNIYGLFSLAFKRFYEVVVSLIVAMMNLVIIMMAISFFIREFSYSRSILLIAMVLQFLLLALWKYLFWKIENGLIQPRHALLIGSKADCERLLGHLHVQPQLKYMVKHICIECDDGRWKTVAEDIDLFIICSELTFRDKAEIVHYCHDHNKQVVFVPCFYELFCSCVNLDRIDDIPVFRPQYFTHTLEQRTLKRAFDIVVSSIILLMLWPLMLVIAAAIKLNDAGPVFYSQIRTGLYGKPFRIYKFRSMQPDAENSTGPVIAEEDDLRVTAVGRFLRAIRLDELPQFFNVLLGDMSIVGPRPERPFFVEKYARNFPEYVYRHNIKPGITGMAQVYGKYSTTVRDKLVYDLMYIQQCNIVTDLVIIMQTLKVLLFKSSSQGVSRGNLKTDLNKYQI